MNKEPKVPNNYQIKKEPWRVYLYLTGVRPLEFGYILYEGEIKREQKVIGMTNEDAFLVKLMEELTDKVSDQSEVVDMILQTKFVNPHLFK